MPKLSEQELKEFELPTHTAEEPSKATLNLRVTGDNVFAAKEMSEGGGTFYLLAHHMTRWDYTDANGMAVPITPENVAKMDLRDLQFLSAILRARIEQALENAAQAVSLDEKKS
ncbi:hypothetical protein AB0H71_28865 [Nocardia sp. NPDC050697]|uniref:hypothetical protein n=1 Tax=Nocardia sp. NPDC050697 TaxID=3155158 RepID=UPI0033FE3079